MKKATSMRLSTAAVDEVTQLAAQLRISKTAVVELAVRAFAQKERREGLSYDRLQD